MLRQTMLLLTASALTITAQAHAATTINVGSVAANFSNANADTASPAYTDTDGRPGNERFTWGVSPSGPNNSLTFISSAAQSVNLDTQFAIGTLLVGNLPTRGIALSSIDLSLSAPVTIGGSTFNPSPFLFNFSYDSTTNAGSLNQCKYPSTVVCADALGVNTINGTGNFTSKGEVYTLFIDGFRDSSGAFSTLFIAQENGTTSAQVVGHFGQAMTSAVPEPSSWAMMIVGMGATGALLRRKRKVRMRVTFT